MSLTMMMMAGYVGRWHGYVIYKHRVGNVRIVEEPATVEEGSGRAGTCSWNGADGA